jgi:chitinase
VIQSPENSSWLNENIENEMIYMTTRACQLLLVMALLLSAGTSLAQNAVVGYFTEGGAASGAYPVKNIKSSGAARMLTHIDYAFGLVKDGRCQVSNAEAAVNHAYDRSTSVDGSDDATQPGTLRGTFHQLQELKREFPGLKILISLGGWGQSGGFSDAAQPGKVREFAQSCVDMFIHGRFAPGIEAPGIIDWEYPVEGGVEPGHPEDKANFTAMVAELRRQMDEVRPGLLLTAALPAEEEYYRNFELKEISKYLDLVSIMAYDLHWNTESTTNLHSPLFHDPHDPSGAKYKNWFGDYAVRGFLAAGVPREKVILGVPFYGKGWQGVPDRNAGLYQSATGPAQAGGSYRELSQLGGAKRRFYSHAVTCSVWSGGVFWSYDCPQAMHKKMEYIKRQHLGGVMFWELSQDTAELELLRSLSGNSTATRR